MKLEYRNSKRSLVGGARGEQRDALLVLQHVILGSQRGVTRPGLDSHKRCVGSHRPYAPIIESREVDAHAMAAATTVSDTVLPGTWLNTMVS